MNRYVEMYEAVAAALDEIDDWEAEALLLDYLAEDDGTVAFLQHVKIPLLHHLGRAAFRLQMWSRARRYLRDAFAFSRAFPGTTPAWTDPGYETTVEFLRAEVGLEVE